MKYRFVLLLLLLPLLGYGKRRQLSSPVLEKLYDKAMAYLDQSPDSVLLICDQALRRPEAKPVPDHVVFHSIKGFAYEHLGLYRKALSEQFWALRLNRQARDTGNLGNTYNNVGVIYDYMGNLDSALYYYQLGYDLRKKEGDARGISASAGNLGLLYLNKGSFKRALDYLFEAKKLAESSGDSSSLSSVLTNIGLAYDKQGNQAKALAYFRESGRIDSLLHDEVNLSLSYNNMASVYFSLRQYTLAETYHNYALDIRTRINLKAGMAQSYHNLALLYERVDQMEKSRVFFEKALGIYKDIGDDYGIMVTLMDYGNHYNLSKQYDKALEYLVQALEVSERQNSSYLDVYRAYDFLATAYAGLGNYREAYRYHVKYSTISDSLLSYGNSKKLTELELEADYEKKKQQDAFEIRQRELRLEARNERARIVQWALLAGITLLLVVVVVIYRGYRNKQKANRLLQQQNEVITNQHREIEEQKNIIEEKNKNITDSIQYAQRLQNAILPPQNLLQQNLREFFILYRPKDIVSGDFYWAHESPVGFLFAVVDCTGHGVPGSMVSIIANNALNRAVNEFRLYEPAAILNKVTSLVEEYFNRNNNNDEIRDGMDISLCLIDPVSKKLEFSGANNSLIIIRNGSEPLLEELRADKQPIGHYEYRTPYQNHTTRLQPGDMLYLYTDGYADQFGGQNGKKFKSSRLKEVLLQISNASPDSQRQMLEQTLDSWTGGFEQNDDICIMGVRA